MMKKVAILVVVVLLAGAGYYFYTTQYNQSQDLSMSKDDSMMMMEDKMEKEDNDAMMMEDKMEKVEMPESALKYELTQDSVAMYVVQKRFLTKEDAEVVGTTENVTGEGWFDVATQQMYLMADVNLNTLASDSETRDKDVLDMLVDTTAKLVLSEIEDEVVLGTPFTTIGTAQVTINKVTNPVTFSIEGTVTETGFTATGSANVLMSDFDLTPPSLLNVYSVDDEMELKFDVTAELVS